MRLSIRPPRRRFLGGQRAFGEAAEAGEELEEEPAAKAKPGDWTSRR
jgi:hypothetical protein